MMKFPTLLKHERDKVGDFQRRVLLHVPIGFIIGISVLGHWAIGIILVALFIFYERNEDVWEKDKAWKDVFGALAGCVISALTLLALNLTNVVSF